MILYFVNMGVKEKKKKETKIVKVYVWVCICFYERLFFFNDKIANILKKNLIF